MIDGMIADGYVRDVAERRFKQIEGFGSHGFLESRESGQLRADRLCLKLAEMPPSRRVLRSAAECAADGVLRAGADRPRCQIARCGGPAGLHQRV
jgi:hypothetical protein